MEPFTVRKENTDFEFIYSLLQDIKESNDALFDKRLKNNEIGEAELIGQSKKMWVLADLGILMLVYRAKVTTRNEPRKTLLSTRFFIKEKKSKHAAISPVRKKIDRKPLKAEQENIPVGNKKESQSPKQQEEKQGNFSSFSFSESYATLSARSEMAHIHIFFVTYL
ncbi:unnamed protein product [Cylicostephanus goldi]|uniref:Uncharacterized protein n=1 Tax=Cylicostephanus goldi TaxID=71465 RepID=A0A3P7M888_CYLGO|nr:unnamed protein product [Cylicostephanus goldi]